MNTPPAREPARDVERDTTDAPAPQDPPAEPTHFEPDRSGQGGSLASVRSTSKIPLPDA